MNRNRAPFLLAIAGLCAAGTASIAVACGVDLVGEASPDAGFVEASTSPSDPSKPAGTTTLEGGSLDTPPDADIIDGETPIPDAGPPKSDAGCTTSITDTFADGILPKWTTYGPVSQGTANGNAYARLIPLDTPGTAAGMFWVPTAKATSFTATFTYYARTDGFDDIGDGLTFTWITAKDANALGTGAVTGAGLGIQPGVSGYAFAFDGYQNSGINDTSSPSFSVLKIESTRGSPASYDWHVIKSGPWSGVYDSWRNTSVKLANGKVSTKVTTTSVFNDVAVTPSPIVAIGFTASTGGVHPIAFFVDTVSITLDDATCN